MTITPRGTAVVTGGFTLTIPSVSCTVGNTLILVAALRHAPATPPVLDTITWGGLTAEQENIKAGLRIDIYIARIFVTATGTHDFVLNCIGTPPQQIAGAVSEINRLTNSFDSIGVNEGFDTTPFVSLGPPNTTHFTNELCVAAIATLGPSTDLQGTWTNGFAPGQRVPATTAMVLEEAFKVIPEIGPVTAGKTGITSRLWSMASTTYRIDPRLGGVTSYGLGLFDVGSPEAEVLPEIAAAIARNDRRYMRQEDMT